MIPGQFVFLLSHPCFARMGHPGCAQDDGPLLGGSGVLHALFAFDDAADDEELFFGAVEEGFGAGEFGCRDDGDESQTHVEGAQHFGF